MTSTKTRRFGRSDKQRKDGAFYNKEQEDMPKISFCVWALIQWNNNGTRLAST